MDVILSSKLVRLSGTALALLALCGSAAGDDASSMVFVAASDADVIVADDASTDEPAEPSDLVVHIADDAPATANLPPTARGDLAVVGGSASPVESGAVIVDAAVQQAGNLQGQAWGRGPRRPAASSGIQGPMRTARRGTSVNTTRPRSPAELQRAGRGQDAPPAIARREPVRTEITGDQQMVEASPAHQRTTKSPEEQAKELLVNAYQLSLTASQEGEYSQIIQWCSGAMRVELDDETRAFCALLSSWALNRRGQDRADAGENQLALADFRAALEFAPNNWRALHNRGVTLAQNGQFAEAFDDLCRVIQLNPKFAKAYANRATLYVQAGDFERALTDYEAAIANDPDLLQAVVGRGRVCHLKGKLDVALECFDAAVRLEPTDADIVCSRADLLSDLGRYEDALLDYAQAIDLNSKFEHAFRNGAWLLATCPDDSIRDVEGALAGAQAALDCGYGERHAALDTMAAALANAGRFAEAVSFVDQALQVAPEESRPAYAARKELYQSGQPYRSTPVHVAAAAVEDDGAESAVYVEE